MQKHSTTKRELCTLRIDTIYRPHFQRRVTKTKTGAPPASRFEKKIVFSVAMDASLQSGFNDEIGWVDLIKDAATSRWDCLSFTWDGLVK